MKMFYKNEKTFEKLLKFLYERSLDLLLVHGQELVELIPHSGKPVIIRREVIINTVWTLVQDDRGITVEKLTEYLYVCWYCSPNFN